MKKWLAVCFLASMATLAAGEAELLFYAPFDGSAEAAFAAGDGLPREAKNLDFAPGVKGSAVRLTKKAHSLLRYPTAGNFPTDRGTISLWFKPEWNRAIGGISHDKQDRRTLASMQRRDKQRHGSGAVWFWCWGDVLRGDTSDLADSYRCTALALKPGVWHHVAFTWSPDQTELYVNGRPRQSARDSQSPLKSAKRSYKEDRPAIPDFFVGGMGDDEQADGSIDEFRLYSVPLGPDEIAALAAEFQAFEVEASIRYPAPAEAFAFRIRNPGRHGLEANWTLGARKGEVALAPGERREVRVPTDGFAPGVYPLIVKSGDREETETFALLRPDNPYISAGESLETERVETLVPDTGLSADRFVSIGDNRMGRLEGRSYLEAGGVKDDRFALRFRLPDRRSIYLIEWDYPDDKERTAEVLAQSSRRQGEEYELQIGYLAGGEYPNTGRMLTQRALYFPRSDDIALIFMTARTGMPAAVSEIRIHRVEGGLPPAAVAPAAPVDGWTRPVGVYYEDPAFMHGFGLAAGGIAQFEAVTDRLAAYLRFSGQNLLVYPVVWYQGMIGEDYQPRPHIPDFLEVMLSRFDVAGLEFMASFNQHNLQRYPSPPSDPDRLHASAYAVHSDGKTNPGGWHGTPPNFNILHPETQKAITADVDRILDVGARHPSFKGIALHLTQHALTWFGDLRSGYNDYAIDAFTRDTGIQVPVDRSDARRGKLYADWLLANARERWIDWRCRKLADFYAGLADRIRARRPDLRLALHVMGPVSELKADPRFGDPDYARLRRREGGLDPAHFRDRDDIVVAQTLIPADSRWRLDRAWEKFTPAHFEFLKTVYDGAGFHSLLQAGKNPWTHMHDRYFESAVGNPNARNNQGNPLKAPWLAECRWRVATLNPSGVHAMKHYAQPLRFNDVLGITKGGFLVGTYGMEDCLTPFAKAFRALPAKRFGDLPTGSETVKARRLVHDGATWFYVVNTGAAPATANVSVARPGTRNLSTGEAHPATFDLRLAPYELQSFNLAGEHPVAVKIP